MRGCYLCGANIPMGESFLSNGRRALCLDCADMISVDDLQCLTGTDTPREMLLALGFYRDFY